MTGQDDAAALREILARLAEMFFRPARAGEPGAQWVEVHSRAGGEPIAIRCVKLPKRIVPMDGVR